MPKSLIPIGLYPTILNICIAWSESMPADFLGLACRAVRGAAERAVRFRGALLVWIEAAAQGAGRASGDRHRDAVALRR